jgi:hypothetical protein
MRRFKDPKYVIQMERSLIPLWLAVKTGEEPADEAICAFCELTSIARDEYTPEMANMIEVFTNISNWEKFLMTRDFSIGHRIHGTILALKCGIPSMIITSDSRTIELAELFKIPRIKYNDIQGSSLDIRTLYEGIDFTPMEAAYPKLLEGYMDFLARRGIAYDPFSSINADTVKRH